VIELTFIQIILSSLRDTNMINLMINLQRNWILFRN